MVGGQPAFHALCGLATEWWTGIPDAKGLTNASGEIVATISLVSVANVCYCTYFRSAFGEFINLPASHQKPQQSNLPKRDQPLATGVFNSPMWALF